MSKNHKESKVKIINYSLSLLAITILFITQISDVTFAQQQKGEFSLLTGYQMLGNIEVYNYYYGGNPNVNGDLDIDDAMYYSAAIGINTSRETMAELQFIYQPTSITFDPYSFGESTTFDADVFYILGTGYYVKQFSRTGSGYFGLSIGAAGLAPQNNLDPAWRFAFGLTLGMKFLLSKNIGIKIQSQGLFPIQWAGGSLYVGTGGAGYGVSAGTSIVQINIGGGIYYAF
jgi:hypothetical protein